MQPLFHWIFSISFLSFGSAVSAQGGLISSPVGTTRDGGLAIYGREGSNNGSRIPYESIQGSPYWRDDFIMAALINASGQVLIKTPVKLNLYANEVYFKTAQGEVHVSDPGVVTKIIFEQQDGTSPVETVFDNTISGVVGANSSGGNPAYVQVLNTGSVRLLKQIVVRFITEAPRLGAMKQYSFSPHSVYFLQTTGGTVHKLKKLSKDALSDKIVFDQKAEEWLRSHPVDLKTEEGVSRFLNYYNEQQISRD